MRLLTALSDTGEILGAQACLVYNGKTVVDACAGVMGPIDPRPVAPDSLFQLHGAASPLLAALALKEVARGALRLDAPVAAAWEGFGRNGKSRLTLAQLLNHQSGLTDAVPPRKTLTQLAELGTMLKYIEGARPDDESGGGGAGGAGSTGNAGGGGAAGVPAAAGSDTAQAARPACHEGLPWGWALSGALQASSGMAVETLLERRLLSQLGLERELKLRVAPGDEATLHRCARVSAVPLMKEMGVDVAAMITIGASGGGGGSAGDGDTAAEAAAGAAARAAGTGGAAPPGGAF